MGDDQSSFLKIAQEVNENSERKAKFYNWFKGYCSILGDTSTYEMWKWMIENDCLEIASRVNGGDQKFILDFMYKGSVTFKGIRILEKDILEAYKTWDIFVAADSDSLKHFFRDWDFHWKGQMEFMNLKDKFYLIGGICNVTIHPEKKRPPHYEDTYLVDITLSYEGDMSFSHKEASLLQEFYNLKLKGYIQ